MGMGEAIKRLEEIKDGRRYPFLPSSQDALGLGIEALKWRKSQKEAGYLDEDDFLPGETEE